MYKKIYNEVRVSITFLKFTLLLMSWPSNIDPKICIHLSISLFILLSILSKALLFFFFQMTQKIVKCMMSRMVAAPKKKNHVKNDSLIDIYFIEYYTSIYTCFRWQKKK